MNISQYTYFDGDVELTGYVCDGAEGGPAPGVLVIHEGPGPGDHIRHRTQLLGERGYVAFALDLYGEGELDLEDTSSTVIEIMTTPGLMISRAKAGLEALTRQPGVDIDRIAAVGFCLGGVVALEMARHRLPVRCAVGFHPSLQRPADSPEGPIDASVLMMIGANDPLVPKDDQIRFTESMEAAGCDWQLHIFGGVGHSFTNKAVDAFARPGFAYDALADSRSLAMLHGMLDEAFDPSRKK